MNLDNYTPEELADVNQWVDIRLKPDNAYALVMTHLTVLP